MGKQIAWNEIDNTAAEILEASDIIWDCAETAFLETKSMKVLCDLLRKEGFEVEEGTGPVLLGEVSQCNDDNTDNRFNPPVGRFPEIEEDEAPYRLLCNEYPTAK